MSEKKRNKYFLREKQLIRFKKKDREIWEAIGNQGWVELETPIHDGYYAEWVLRDDILRRDDANAFQEALDACKEKIWCKKPDFKYKNRKTKKWEVQNPKMLTITKDKYEALSPAAKKFFFESAETKRYWQLGFKQKHYACSLTYQLVVKVSKAFITHRREHDGVLYQMDAENEKMMFQTAGDNNPWGNRGWKNKFWRKHENKKEKFKTQREIVDKIKTYKTTHDTDLD